MLLHAFFEILALLAQIRLFDAVFALLKSAPSIWRPTIPFPMSCR